MGRRPPNIAQNPPEPTPPAEWWCRAEVRARRAPELPPADSKARAFRALASARHRHSAGGWVLVGSVRCWAATVALFKKLFMLAKSMCI